MFERAWWEDRYGAPDAVWSGRVNRRLAEHAGGLTPGTALDVGCGEGADTIWLAEHGWAVTAVDFSQAGLDRARAHAEAAGADVAGRITWLRADLRTWTPPRATFALVSAQFLHQVPDVRRAMFAGLAEAVRPGGTLLLVGHHPLDLDAGHGGPSIGHEHREAMLDAMFTADQVAADLDPAAWQVVTAEAAGRRVPGHDGEPTTAHDAVLNARRLDLTP
jgi:2-polyprenyl-3-methyl-5-hydroxy-6-metoxy-1,4-benzoquinol methylase